MPSTPQPHQVYGLSSSMQGNKQGSQIRPDTSQWYERSMIPGQNQRMQKYFGNGRQSNNGPQLKQQYMN